MAVLFLGTRPNMSESHSEISTRVPLFFCIFVLCDEKRRSGEARPYSWSKGVELVCPTPGKMRRC